MNAPDAPPRPGRSARRSRAPAAPLLALVLLLVSPLAMAGENWQPLLIARFGNIDAVDAEDGDFAAFLRTIRNDGRFIPPLRTLIGPEIRNSTFYGLVYEAWMECVVLMAPRPGPTERLWVFPVDNRDDYLTQLNSQGLFEYEGMDGITILREMDQDGNIHDWHLEWLPGNVVVFGSNRDAVAAARQIYAENSAARGLLARVGGEYLEPDAMVRLYPALLASWQNATPGVYWWRETVTRLARDVIGHWQPNPARVRLVNSLAESLVGWPRSLRRLDLGIWFEREGVEYRLEAEGDFHPTERDELAIFRKLPERTALAYAVPVTEASFNRLGANAGAMLLAAAGGVVTTEARVAAGLLFDALRQVAPGQAALAWIPPPPGSPELGATRLLIAQCRRPERLDGVWTFFQHSVTGDTPLAQAMAQIGWSIAIADIPEVPDAAELIIAPAAGGGEGAYYRSACVVRRRGNWLALAVGDSRPDAEERRRALEHRAGLAQAAIDNEPPGPADVRQAFMRVGSQGASFVGLLEPVRFLQLALAEAADWRPRTPDQPEPPSTQLAREMLEYGSGVAWSAAGELDGDVWRVSGGLPWESLSRLSAALGITESIGMD